MTLREDRLSSDGSRGGRADSSERSARESEILDAAALLFAETGYRDTSLASIAGAAGLTQQGVLHYFPSKKDLLLALLRRKERRDRERVRLTLERYPADVARVLQALVEQNEGDPTETRLHAVLLAEATSADHPAHEYFRNRYRRVHGALSNNIARQVDAAGASLADKHVAALAHVAVAVMDGLQMQWLLDPDEGPTMTADFQAFTEMLSSAMAGDREGIQSRD